MTLGSRSSPAITSAGSPGSNCCSEKIRIDTKNSVGISCRIRLPRKFSMAHAHFDARGSYVRRKTLAMSTFHPPLWGRGREGGNSSGFCACGTPHPSPPPQGGREQRESAPHRTRDTPASLDRSLQLQSDHAHQPVRHLLIAFELGGVRDQELAVIEIDQGFVVEH